MKNEFSTEYIKHIFTEEEKREISISMAQKVAELQAVEDSKKAIMSDLKSQIDSLQATVNSAATKINNGYEMQNVKCRVDKDFSSRMVYFFRVDTDELVKSRDMRADEIQMSIDDAMGGE